MGVGFPSCITGHMTGGLHLGGLNPGGSVFRGFCIGGLGGLADQPVCQQGFLHPGGLGRHPLPQLHGILRDTGGTHPTGMLCCYVVL